MSDLNSQAVNFSSELAATLFATYPSPERVEDEDALLLRTKKLLMRLSATQVVRLAPGLDLLVVPRLSGMNRLELLRLLEDKSAAAIMRMPTALEMLEHLRNAAELADVLSPAAIERIRIGIAELQKEDDLARKEEIVQIFDQPDDEQIESVDYDAQDAVVYASASGKTVPSLIAISDLPRFADLPETKADDDAIDEDPIASKQMQAAFGGRSGGWNPIGTFTQIAKNAGAGAATSSNEGGV